MHGAAEAEAGSQTSQLGYSLGKGMTHYTATAPKPEFAAQETGCSFVSHQQAVGAGYFYGVTTVIPGSVSSVKALTGVTEQEQLPCPSA